MGNFFSRNSRSSSGRDPCTTDCDVSEVSSLSSEVFQQFYSKLVETLPMDDAVFVAKLFSNRISADKAVLFLDSVIEPSVTSDGGSSFDKLLHLMEYSEYQHLKELVVQIRTSLRQSHNNDRG